MRQTVTLTRNGSLLCSQSGRSREASVLQLLAPGRLPQSYLSFRSRVSGGSSGAPKRYESPPFAPHEPFHGELWFASCARSLRPLIQSTIGMCKPHQRCADNRSHHAGCVCRAVQRASYILRCVRYLSTNRMFTPHLSTCELQPGCVCVSRIVAGGIL
jgi:hypothetical protein